MITGGVALATWLAIALGAANSTATSPTVRGVAPATVAPAVTSPPVPAVPWRTLAPGARSAALAAGGIAIFLVEFDLEHFRADVFVGEGTPPRAETAANLRGAQNAVAVVNGGFFDEHRAPLGLRISAGKTRIGLRPRVDWGVLVIADRHVRIVHSRDFRPDPEIRAAIQVGPRLIVDGVALKLKPQSARRTAVALDKAGRRLTLVVVDRAIQADVLAARLAAAGFDSALMLDGGPSTQLSLKLGAADIDAPGLYPVPDLLAIFPR